MKKPSRDDQQWDALHEKIIGLGERSIRKSYYPELQQKIKELEREVAEREAREKELKRNYENRAVLNQLLKLSLEDISVDELCRITVKKLYSLSWLVPGTGVTIFLLDGEQNCLVRKASMGEENCESGPCETVPLGKCLCGLAVTSGDVQFASHVDHRHTIRPPGMLPHGHYCVPILLSGQALGVISLSLPAGHDHDQREEDFFVSVANTLAGIVQRHHILAEVNRYERMLAQAQKIDAIGTLSGGIAHDFNNLLAPILGYAELALRELDPESRPARRVAEILQAASRARELVRQILTLSHKVEPRLDELKPVPLEKVIDEVLTLVRASIPTSIEIVAQYDTMGCTALVDPTHIHQIVLNLCTNAYHAMRETGGTITITLEKIHLSESDVLVRSAALTAGDYLSLKIADSGTGIATEQLERIFDPYFTTKKQGEGTGLGLAVVNGIVKSYSGHISVESEPGQGATFDVLLPSCAAQGAGMNDIDAQELLTGSESILVIDDEPQVGQMATDSLDTLGYRTMLYTNPQQALEAFEQRPQDYDLILTDMTMPKMNGLELLQRCRQVRPDIPVILCTGFSELVNEPKAHSLGFQRYLMKPVVLTELAQTVRDVLDNIARP